MPLDREQMKKDYEESKSAGSGLGDFWTAQEGSNLIRFMPEWKEGVGLFYKKTYNHWYQKQPICCQHRMFGQRCYLCEKVKELRATGDVTDKKKAKDLQAQKNVYANIVDLKNKAAGVQIWRVGGFTQIMAYANDEVDYPDITDPKKGFDFKIERTGTGLDTEYVNRARKTSSPIGDMNWLKQLNDLNQFSKVEEYENQKSLYGYIFGEGPPPENQPSEIATEPDDDEFDDNPIQKDEIPKGMKLADDKVDVVKAAYCVSMDKWGWFNEEKQNCKDCTVKANCVEATKTRLAAVSQTTKTQDAEKLTQKLKDAGE